MGEQQNNGFSLIWLYWLKKYILQNNKADNRQETTEESLAALRKMYMLETVEAQTTQAVEQKVALIREMSSSGRLVYVVDPQKEVKEIQTVIYRDAESKESAEYKIGQLYSYYLNSKNVFVIYRNNVSSVSSNNLLSLSSQNEATKDNISDCHNRRQNRTESNGKDSEIANKGYHSNQNSIECRNDELGEDCERIQNKIEGLQMLNLFTEWDGVQLWNCKFKHMPHIFIKIKDIRWTKSIHLPLMHPSQPKKLGQLPILPRITKLKPGIDKLLPFVSYVKLLQKYFSNLSPTIDSIYQYNNLPYVFVQEDSQGGGWNPQTSIGLLCYYVVYGDTDTPLTNRRVERWAQENESTLLAKTIKQMNKRQRDRAKMKQKIQSKNSLFFNSDATEQIW